MMINKVGTNNSKKEVRFKYINKEDLEFFKEILTAETIGGKEYLIKDTLIEKLEKLNFKIEVDSMGNISAVRGNSANYPMLNAHMDIVDCSWSYSYGYSSYNQYNKKTKKKKDKKDTMFDNTVDEAEYRYEKILECSEMSAYDNSYDFYTALTEEIAIARTKHENKKEFLSEIFKTLEFELEDLTSADYDNMGLDCMNCKNDCKNRYTCRDFKLDLVTDYDKERFLDKLESYCIQVIEEIESLADEEIAYEMSCAYDYDYDYEDEEETETEEDEAEEEKKPEPEYEVVVDLENNKIFGKGKTRVLGGDDKCGIFIALKVAEMLQDMPMKILFTVREESGCIGISHFVDNRLDFFSDVKYSLTIDRRDKDNLLWSQLGTRSCDDEFAGRVAREGVKEGIAVKLMDGSVADVIHIRNHVPNSINMSAGYYDAHSSREYIVPTDVDNIIGWVKNILTNV